MSFRASSRYGRTGWIRLLGIAWGAATAGLIASTPRVLAQEVDYSGSLQYSTGSYVFAQRTHSVYLFSTLGLGWDRIELDASVPVVLQNSGVVTYVGGSPYPTGGPDHDAVGGREPGTVIPGRRGGGSGAGGGSMGGQQATDSVTFADEFRVDLGDPGIFGVLEAYTGTGFLRSVRMSSGVKVPLNDLESGVGTGEWDYSAGASIVAAAGGALLFGDLSYWWLGDLPDLTLQDGLSYGVGLGLPILGGRASLLVNLTGSQAIAETVDPPLVLGVSAGFPSDTARQLSVGFSVGLTEASPDLGISLGWTIPLSP